MEVLLSIGESKKVLVVTEDTLFSLVEQELSILGDVALLPPGFSSVDLPGTSKQFYILQRWSDKWSAYVDVKLTAEVIAGDHLKVVLCPRSSESCVSCLKGCIAKIDCYAQSLVCKHNNCKYR